MTGPRVAVTGLGVKSPAGLTPDAAFDALVRGRGLAQPVQWPAAERVPAGIACLVPDFDRAAYFGARELNSMDRTTQLAVAAAVDAWADCGLPTGAGSPRHAVALGTGGSGVATNAEGVTRAWVRDGQGMGAFALPTLMTNAAAARVALRLGVGGASLTYAAACASGGMAIGEAFRMIRWGAADVVVAGGAESCVSPLVMESFRRVGALSGRLDEPSAASRPFDADRDGFVMGEGAAFLVLERWEHAAARGARIYAELAGYGSNSDNHHIVAPRPDGEAAARCMAAGLADAGVPLAEVGHINAHGTSTVLNDQAEAAAIQRCFGDSAPPVTAPKGVTGHMIGAAGAFEALATVLSVRLGTVPPVANHQHQHPDGKLDVVAGSPRSVPPAPALSNSFGFGGHNVTLVFAPA